MRKELNISLPVYKLIYATCFIFILSLVRGVTYSNEIGIALESPVALLALVFCSDTYVMEIISKRSEVSRLYPMKKRVSSQYRRMLIQVMFLFWLSLIGYGLFWMFQQPVSWMLTHDLDITLKPQNEVYFFFIYMSSMIVTICLWGFLSNVIACLFRNMWWGIGCSMLLWLSMNSKAGAHFWGKWNLFSYTFRDIEDLKDMSWLCGKGISVCLILLSIMLLPTILKKRG